MNSILKQCLLITTILTLVSCTIFPAKPTDYTTYVVRTLPCETVYSRSHAVLFVTNVEADPLYDTDNIAYSDHPFQVEYFAKNKWSETPAKMVKPLLIKTLKNTHHYRAITTSSNVAKFDYILNTKILEMRQVFSGCSSYVVFRMNAEILDAKTRNIIASKEFRSTHAAQQLTPYGGVPAANRSVADVLGQVAEFCVNHT